MEPFDWLLVSLSPPPTIVVFVCRFGCTAATTPAVTSPSTETKFCSRTISAPGSASATLRRFGPGPDTWASCGGPSSPTPAEVRLLTFRGVSSLEKQTIIIDLFFFFKYLKYFQNGGLNFLCYLQFLLHVSVFYLHPEVEVHCFIIF